MKPEEDLDIFTEAVFRKYSYDFRNYTRSTMRRRVALSLIKFRCSDIAELLDLVERDNAKFSELLPYLTVPVTEMFRDPDYFAALRTEVVPLLKTYPSIKIWVAGCSTGEEAYSLAIMLKEEGLLERAVIYATDINPMVLAKAKEGSFNTSLVSKFRENYQKAGGTKSFSDYYRIDQNTAVLDGSIRNNILFSDHSLASDSVFSEVHLVSCRNVLIYFNRELQDRVFGLFKEALCPLGFLGLGNTETVRFSVHSPSFKDYVNGQKIFRKTRFFH